MHRTPRRTCPIIGHLIVAGMAWFFGGRGRFARCNALRAQGAALSAGSPASLAGRASIRSAGVGPGLWRTGRARGGWAHCDCAAPGGLQVQPLGALEAGKIGITVGHAGVTLLGRPPTMSRVNATTASQQCTVSVSRPRPVYRRALKYCDFGLQYLLYH